MDKVTLAADERKETSKALRSKLRQSGRVPGIFYSKHQSPIMFDVLEKTIKPLIFTSKTNLITLQFGEGKEFDCVIKEVQFDPVTEKILHIDLLGLTKGEKIQLEIPILLVGSPAGVKEGGIIQQSLHKLDVECDPTNIPAHVEVDITKLNMGDSIHVGAIKVENLDILNPEDAVIVSVVHPQAEEAEAPAEEGAAEPEVINKGKEKEE